MRLSCDANDHGYHPDHAYHVVRLNGAVVEFVQTADEELGKLWRFKRGEDGNIILDAVRKPVVFEETGQVQLERVGPCAH